MSVPTDLTLFKRNNGIYYFAYRDGSRGRWKSTGCTTKPDALRCLTERQDLFKPRLPRMSLGRFVAEYETYAASRLSPRTLSGYRDTLKGFQRFVGDVPLSTLTPRMADAYLSQRAQKVRPATVNIELRSLRAIFSVARKWGYCERNPLQDARPLSSQPDRPARFFSRA